MTSTSSSEVRTKTATVVGYHGYQNLGDDIFRRVVCEWLSGSLGISKCYISTRDDLAPLLTSRIKVLPFSNPLPRINRLLWINVFNKSLQSNVLIFSAGSIFTIQPFFLIYLVLRLLRLFRGKGLQILAIGVSIGPFRNSRDQYWCLKGLSLMDQVLIRDFQSKSLIDMSEEVVNVTSSFDLALNWTPKPSRPKLVARPPLLGIAITERAFGSCETSHTFNCSIITEALHETLTKFTEVQIKILCVCNDGRDGDRIISRHFQETLARKWKNRVETIYYENDKIEEMEGIIAECASLISARMHAGIVGMLASVPVYQISYAEKIRNFYLHSELSTRYLHDHTHLDQQSIIEFISMSIMGELQDFASTQKSILEEKGQLVSSHLQQLAEKLIARSI